MGAGRGTHGSKTDPLSPPHQGLGDEEGAFCLLIECLAKKKRVKSEQNSQWRLKCSLLNGAQAADTVCSAHGHSTVFRDEWDTAASSGGTPGRAGAFTLGAAFADVRGRKAGGWVGDQLGTRRWARGVGWGGGRGGGAGAGVLAARSQKSFSLLVSAQIERAPTLLRGASPVTSARRPR